MVINQDMEAVNAIVREFHRFEKSLNGESASATHEHRQRAISHFAQTGFPTTRNEEWRFTNVQPIAKTRFCVPLDAAAPAITEQEIQPYVLENSIRLTFVNGLHVPALSCVSGLPSGVIVRNLREVLVQKETADERRVGALVDFQENGFTALNTAFVRDGAWIEIPDGVTLDRPIHLLYIAHKADGMLLTPRNIVVGGPNSRLAIVESFVALNNDAYLTNAVTEIFVDDGATVEHDKMQKESPKAFHVSTTHIRQRQRTTLVSNVINLGGVLVRNSTTCTLTAEHSEATLNGLSLGTSNQLIDNHTTIDHAKPNCISHEMYKSILDGNSRGVFNGKIFVRKDAQKTDAKQTNKTLLLSDNATIDTKPQLEIFADDVKCTHGATVGQLDDEQVFYLRSRGIGNAEARDILTFAFARDVVDRVHVDELRNQIESLVHSKLHHGRLVS
ncbi:MAG: Fe-S cluster assembly protein SufD [Ignavibacteriales bacterium]|nr:Fe-S cluster assembly protein SufD [Ignavibacteriales bacterium]